MKRNNTRNKWCVLQVHQSTISNAKWTKSSTEKL